ncbi:uncharacterized protein LOC134467322 [Engraulis encrasicolus]|uniref:uncharacterized protein LOC134467322 n=1 Tax=Engraulis encrasicolus TaxID=184585 RepID=UPI002FCF2D9F
MATQEPRTGRQSGLSKQQTVLPGTGTRSPDVVSATGITTDVGEADKSRIRGELDSCFSEAKNMEELSDLAPSDAQVEAFKVVYEREKMAMLGGQPSILATLNAGKTSSQFSNLSDEDEHGFHKFLSVMTDSEKLSQLMGDPDSETETEFVRNFNSILNPEDGCNSPHREEIMGFYRRSNISELFDVFQTEEKDCNVLKYYAKGANLSGLHSKQLAKYMIPAGYEDRNSPYSIRPSLKANYTPHKSTNPDHQQDKQPLPHGRRATTSGSIFGGRASMGHRMTICVKIDEEDEIDLVKKPVRKVCCPLSGEREGAEVRQKTTPVKIKVPLTVKNREKLTYDDTSQIRKKAQQGVSEYLRTQVRAKRQDTLRMWVALQGSYSTLANYNTYPETFSTYSWSWGARRNLVEINELTHGPAAAAAAAARMADKPHFTKPKLMRSLRQSF